MNRIISFLKSLHPISVFFFASAVLVVVLGLFMGIKYKILQVVTVAGNVIAGLLAQWYFERDGRE
ncbi:hypothetical protein DRQ21_07305 [Candidatus Fermentibacteria bacterium]|nr:MAG: hypothetical protein DRQ21_07305 [Candidatus Fermentibacteria bacterium]